MNPKASLFIFFLATCLAARAQVHDEALHPGQTPAQVLDGTARFVAHYEPSQMLRLAFVLTPPHPAEEAQFLEDVQDKQSPTFHQFLSPDDWYDRFGPSVEDEQAVVDWAESQGFTITHRYKNKLLVDVEAQAGVIEKALQITINSYQASDLDSQSAVRTMYSNDRDPVLPSRLAGVVESVQGLNSIEGVRPASSNGNDEGQHPDYVPGPAFKEAGSAQADADLEAVKGLNDTAGVTPQVTLPVTPFGTVGDYLSSNGYDYQALMNQKHCCNPNGWTTGSGANSSIAIAAYGNVSFSDLTGFHDGFSYLAYNVVKYSIDGGYACSGTADINCVEATLDTEWALATANSEGSRTSTATVYVYEAPTGSESAVIDVYNQILDDSHARVFSTSWGCAEDSSVYSSGCSSSTMLARDHVLASMAGQGWTLVAASGDWGATAACAPALGVGYPASDPNVVAVGGTLILSKPQSEIAWTGLDAAGFCPQNQGGSGGGFSNFWNAPAYQAYMGHTKRAVPDVALSAQNPHDVYFEGRWTEVIGTSVAAPMMAGFFAQEDAYLISLGDKCGTGTAACAPLGNANYPIYREGQYVNSDHYPFYDITSGCNSNEITAEYHLTPYCAHAGFDQVTGWGSSNMLQLAWAINWYTAAADGRPYIEFSGPAINKWYNNRQTVTWNIVDYTGGTGLPGTGIAGFTQGWDSIPSDPYSEPHSGTGNSFYSGPEYVNVANGCIALTAGGPCAGGVSQGCHTVHVEGWNNQGKTTGDQFYGPLCYDSVAPTIAMSRSPAPTSSGWYTKPVAITLSATDPGGSAASGVARIYYSLTPSCFPGSLSYCTAYTSPFTLTEQGMYHIYYLSEDNAGNFSKLPSTVFYLDWTAPVTTATLSGKRSGGSFVSSVKVSLEALDNVSGVKAAYYELDRKSAKTYSETLTVKAVGSHTVKFWSVDYAGNVETAKTVQFTIAN